MRELVGGGGGGYIGAGEEREDMLVGGRESGVILVEGNGRSGVRLVREGREKNGREGGCKGRRLQLRRCEGSGRSGREEACRTEGSVTSTTP